jgi:hypothetical protein
LAAAIGGHLGVLQWARENGCEWKRDTCYDLALNTRRYVLGLARWISGANVFVCVEYLLVVLRYVKF